MTNMVVAPIAELRPNHVICTRKDANLALIAHALHPAMRR
jgi:hypothetical protein